MINFQRGQPKKCVSLLLILAFILPHFFAGVTVSSAAPPEVKVGISLLHSYVELSFDSGYCLINMAEGSPLPLAEGRYRLVAINGNIQVQDRQGNNRGLFSGPLYLKPLSSQPAEQFFQLHNARSGLEYRGTLEIFLEGNSLKAVNILDLESYLRGVLPREISSSWGNYGGMEALKAQAVASRTYTLYYQSRPRHPRFQLCDMKHCQQYGGKSCETENTDRALRETRGEILTYNGVPISAYYHASNGGFTEVPQNVWTGSYPYYDSVADPYDDPNNPLGLSNFVKHRYADWKKDVPLHSVGALLAGSGFKSPGTVEQVDIAAVSPSGRVQELYIRGAGGNTVSLLKEESRNVFDLASLLYTIRSEAEPRVWIASCANGVESKACFPELEGKWALSGHTRKRMLIGETFSVLGEGVKNAVPYASLIFEGHGSGHGVGLSQNGAYNRSRVGQEYKEILSFYYPGTVIETNY
jgi:stage II sporulation protein D